MSHQPRPLLLRALIPQSRLQPGQLRGEEDERLPAEETQFPQLRPNPLHLELAPQMSQRLRKQLRTPLAVLRGGQEVARETGTRLEYAAKEPGVYRAEVWVTVAGEERPWIYANPIRVE